ncbi:FAD-binding protein [Orrella marina]|uniref:FAD-dependent oxidoreductase 2 FAD-binding domain-containing protein n=1 Tax=Orrella marina TaxID=2163011 RepID=A0A2R4XK25_9BURK|nr:FAD-binding protein [Orrella marina]AWB34136.1 hypothetical protein DBV39_10940 [Orrella marina]
MAELGSPGLGYAKPFLPLGNLLRTGYLVRADSVGGLAERIGIDSSVLEETISNYNTHAQRGEDPEFGKGKDLYCHYLGDPGNSYNPNVAPLDKGPYYAVWMYAGDIGNFAGIRTDEHARVLRTDSSVIPGLFAVGNDMASVFRGSYPGGGSLIGPAMTFGFTAARCLAKQEGN